MLSNDRRQEIATFLRIRRARLQPEQAGLPRGTRRRTPGLRREEVAALAEVSTEWYTWLEQARDVRPSADALQRIGTALRLEPAESQHLLALGGYGRASSENGSAREAASSPQLQRLMDQLEYCPAWVFGERWDIVAWNRAAIIIHGDLAAMEGIERNAIHQLFLNPRFRRMLVDWEPHARDCVAKLRLAHSRHVDDPWFNELIHLLRARSPEFVTWWDEHNVQLPGDGVKVYDHPEAGRLTFDYAVLVVSREHGKTLHLVTYIPAPGTGTQERMEALLGASEPHAHTHPEVAAAQPGA
ncbi:MAG: helix-turn-helix transcriptional regulator [Thermoanaerobaculia bacterium]